MELYNYKATVLKVIDGDTVRLNIDLGFRVFWTSNCRIAGVNAPEMGTTGGENAKAWLKDFLHEGDILLIKSVRLDKYGRPVFDGYLEVDGKVFLLSEQIIKAGHAVKY